MINENVHTLGQLADQAFDQKDGDSLRNITDECLKLIELKEYTILEKGILAYHGATSCSNYLSLEYRMALVYSDSKSNEQDFELCLLLFRLAIDYITTYQKIKDIQEESEENYYASNYLLKSYTNYANLLNTCGRMIRALSYLKIGVNNDFPMATGNFAETLLDYATFDYDTGHQMFFLNESYHLLEETIMFEKLDPHAKAYYISITERLKRTYPNDVLEEPYEFEDYSLGDSNDEVSYRKWCLENTLFLNTLNDAFPQSISATDIIHLPNIITKINEGPKYHGLYNQIKQEYVSARFMYYDASSSTGAHFSDKDVHLVNTLDYPSYGISIEKMKYSYRSLYSLFDRIAFFINEYFEIGVKQRDVSYLSIWNGQQKRGKQPYKFKVNLKSKMTDENAFNLPLVGLYWLCKDIGKKKVEHHYVDPSIEQISKIRHHLEHRYLKVHDGFLYSISKELRNSNEDPLAYSITVDELSDSVMKLLHYVREGIILLSMAVNFEEQLKQNTNDKEAVKVPMFLSEFEDDWKQLF